MAASRHCLVPCARCGRAAAEITLLPTGESFVSPWRGRERLERTDFLGACTRFGSPEELASLFEAVARADYAAAREIDPDFVGFHCKACGLPYCDTCWSLEPFMDDGFYDYTLGTCPLGHVQMVDD
jgi:hypothetical protein